MTHRLRPWHPEDAQELFEATADPEIARQLPPFEPRRRPGRTSPSSPGPTTSWRT